MNDTKCTNRDRPSPIRSWKTMLSLITVVVATISAGCQRQPSMYTVELVNRTGSTVPKNVLVKWGRDRVRILGLGLGGSTGVGGITSRIPRSATVEWNDQTGKQCSVEIAIPSSSKVKVFVFALLPDDKVVLGTIMDDDTINQRTKKRRKLTSNGGPSYRVCIENPEERLVKNVVLRFGEMAVIATGDFYSRLGKNYTDFRWLSVSGVPYPITETATLTWADKDGVNHRQVLPLRKAVSADLNGKWLLFSMGTDNVVTLTEHNESNMKE